MSVVGAAIAARLAGIDEALTRIDQRFDERIAQIVAAERDRVVVQPNGSTVARVIATVPGGVVLECRACDGCGRERDGSGPACCTCHGTGAVLIKAGGAS